MIQLDELKAKREVLARQLLEMEQMINYKSLKQEHKSKEEQTLQEGFWSERDRAQRVLRELKTLNAKLVAIFNLKEAQEELEIMFELAQSDVSELTLKEIAQKLAAQEKALNVFKLETLLTGKYDFNNALLSFHAGAGGTESEDWANMLYRMYSMWCADHGFEMKTLYFLPGDECGIKSASVLVKGPNAYGFLRSEMGVHRLVRISPFDSSGRRHTSFASLEVVPELDDSVDIKIDDAELKIDTFRASGAGGQHINKTESAVRITHLKTGIVVACQNERSQHQNKELAMKMLISKLIEIKEKEHLERIEDIKGNQGEIAWGSQMRSYVFMPYTLVKDHRTGCETGNISAVMNGKIDEFIMAYLKQNIN